MASRQAENVRVRIDPEAKRVLERAAALSNTTVSAFVASHALEAADRLIRERERMVLSERDWNVFFDAVADPPEPNAALRAAFATHDRLVSKTTGA